MLRDAYGANPLHLLATIASLAFAGLVLVQVFDGLSPWNFVLWLVGASIAHDLIAYPLYTLADRIAQRTTGTDRARAVAVPGINYVRVPAIVSGVLFVVWFPLILGLSEDNYIAASGRDTGAFLPRWLAITAALFAVSALLYAVRLRRARRSPA
ncbi:MAG: hypothetical protein ACRDL3_12815 [Solirubrobacterales bacterium]